jgi:signal transduction histidine kinase/CheY-like chemotaxis protein
MKSRRAIHAAVVIVASVALVAGYLLLTNASYEQLRKNDYDIGRSSIETSVENTMRLIEDERSLHTNDDGSVDDEEAKAEVYRILMDQKVTSNQYVWVNEVLDYGGSDNYARIFLHQNTKNKVGTYLTTDIEDAVGNKPYASELEGIVRDGELWQTYYYKNYLDDDIEKKLSFAKLYRPYNWIVASGIPESDMYATSNAYLDRQRGTAPFVIAAMLGLGTVLLVADGYREKYVEQKLASEKAKAVSETKSHFLANMSHEMRTPLNGIIGFTYLLKHNLDDPDQAKGYVDKIDQSSRILLSTINDVLDVSAIESGKLKIAHGEFSIKECMYSVTNLFYQQCEDKGIRFESRAIGLEYENLIGDTFRIRQILLNLLSNAVKFTSAGGLIVVDVREEKTGPTEVLLRITVRDTGCGMSEDLQKRLYGAFEQENAETAREHGGSGLGLSIVKTLVNLMDGTITLDSRLGEGTTFEVALPLEVAKTSTIANVPDMSNLDMLVVDDSEDTCEYIYAIAQRWGVGCEYTTDPRKALEMARDRIRSQRSYNVYILDMKMPEMNGIELSRRLSEIVDDDAVIMMVSGYDLDEFRQEAKDAGVHGFLQKPVFPSELFNAIIGHRQKTGIPVKDADGSLGEALRGVKVLLAEDNEINQQVAQQILEHHGATVRLASNGQEAIDLLGGDEQFDVVLMDIRMPVKDGYQAAREIRAMGTDYASSIPIVALTANSFQTDVDEAQAAGMNCHIGKPIDPERLVAVIQGLVTGGGQDAAGDAPKEGLS